MWWQKPPPFVSHFANAHWRRTVSQGCPNRPWPTWSKLRLFEITTPRRYGGLQLDVHTFMDAMVELGRGDASVSWAATLVNIKAAR
jgi:alkylation response protein AidB-like acyl-CoA dehydrogenase